MIGLDTNVVVRAVVDDPGAPEQCAAAASLFRSLRPDGPGFVSEVVLVEVSWMLRSAFGFDRASVRAVIAGLASRTDLVVEHASRVDAALRDAELCDREIADALIAAAGRDAGCARTATFDKAATVLPGDRKSVV